MFSEKWTFGNMVMGSWMGGACMCSVMTLLEDVVVLEVAEIALCRAL